MIQTNFHTHTVRCHHAKGEDEEYIVNAIKAGYKEIGFSDHSPFYPEEGCRQSSYRVYVEDIKDYFDSLRALREKYKDQITIHIGFEMEYYPEYFDSMLKLVKDSGAEYLILGQHFLGNEINKAHYSGIPSDQKEHLDTYCDLVVEGLKTGVFTYVAHADLLNFTGDQAYYEERMRRMIREVKALDYPLEFNRLGFAEKRAYPRADFWKIVGEEGARTVIGLDAHTPDVYLDTESVAQIEAYLAEFGITAEVPVMKAL